MVDWESEVGSVGFGDHAGMNLDPTFEEGMKTFADFVASSDVADFQQMGDQWDRLDGFSFARKRSRSGRCGGNG